MGGKKRSIPIELIKDKARRAVCFSKRRDGLFRKSTKLCLLSGAQIAILATPVSSKPHASFYSYGHSSVDSVVSAFLKNERPKEELGQYWWEDEELLKSDDPNELKSAMDSMSRMLKRLKALNLEAMAKQKVYDDEEKVKKEEHQEETLSLVQSSNVEYFDLDEIFGMVTKSEGMVNEDLDFDVMAEYEKSSEAILA